MELACRRCARPLAVSDDGAACPGCGARVARSGGIWRVVGDGAPGGFARERRQHLAEISARHFWFPPRRRLLGRRLDLCGRGFARALELGCGTGDFLPELARRAGEVVGVDGYPESLAAARAVCPRAELLAADLERGLPLAAGQFDLVVALDVLEHVDSEIVLEEVRRLAAPAAVLLVAVPALPSLWSELDRAAGHRQRYRRADLAARLAAHGFRLVAATHYQMLLLPLVYLSRRLGGARFAGVERRPPAALGRLLGAVNHLEVACFGARDLPWGSSLIATAERAA
jgi:SAM-dependent methyltransferase